MSRAERGNRWLLAAIGTALVFNLVMIVVTSGGAQ